MFNSVLLQFVRRPLLGKNVPMQLPPCKKLAVGQGNAVNALQSQATRGVATPKTAKAAEQICRKAKPAQNVDPDPDIIVVRAHCHLSACHHKAYNLD